MGAGMDDRRKVIRKVLRAYLQMYAAMRRMGRGLRRHHGASDTALLLLRVIAETEPISIGELADLTGYHVASLGQMLERMEDSGWIERFRDEADRRKILLRITTRGRELSDSSPLFGPWRLGAIAEKLSGSQLEELSAGFDWLSSLFSPPTPKEDEDVHHCGTRGHHRFGKRIHIDFGPGGFDFEKTVGDFLGNFPGFGFARRFSSRRERLDRLEGYLADLKSEVEAVQEEIARIRAEGDDPDRGREA
jgi:DNA-binding MarR family transcriptional regulator